jgi:hypothetical protein
VLHSPSPRAREHVLIKRKKKTLILFFSSFLFSFSSLGLLVTALTGDPTVAAVWRRQTFTAAVENVASETTRTIFEEHVPTLAALLGDSANDPLGTRGVLNDAYRFSRMLHGAPSTSGPAADAFYRSFVPELGSTLYPRRVELAKRCRRSERGELDRVGVTIFPGLVKVSRTLPGPGIALGDTMQTVVRRAQVICECALQATSFPGSAPPPTPTAM